MAEMQKHSKEAEDTLVLSQGGELQATTKASTAIVHAEKPTEPPHPYDTYKRIDDELPSGNPKANMAFKMHGYIGHFYRPNRAAYSPTLVEIDDVNIRSAVYVVLKMVLDHAVQKKGMLDESTMYAQNCVTASHLTNGVMIAIYVKLRHVNFLDDRVDGRYDRIPTVPENFRIPRAYAQAVTQLGRLKLSGTCPEVYLSPVHRADIARFGASPHLRWSPTLYAQAVNQAEKLEMAFDKPNLTVKMGSSFWAYRPVLDGDIFSLECPYPEENFTESTAVLAALFCRTVAGDLFNPIVNLEALGHESYGSMLRGPPEDFAVSAFHGFAGDKSIDFRVTN